MVDSGEYLWECLKYVELNMVRCRVVKHPREWEWSGYSELMGWRKRNQLLDIEKLLWLVRAASWDEFQKNFNVAVEEAIINDELKRQEKWTMGIAVGSQSFVEVIEQKIRVRQRLDTQQESGAWILREEHGSLFEGQNASIDRFRR